MKVPVFASDEDFARIARVSPLRLAAWVRSFPVGVDAPAQGYVEVVHPLLNDLFECVERYLVSVVECDQRVELFVRRLGQLLTGIPGLSHREQHLLQPACFVLSVAFYLSLQPFFGSSVGHLFTCVVANISLFEAFFHPK